MHDKTNGNTIHTNTKIVRTPPQDVPGFPGAYCTERFFKDEPTACAVFENSLQCTAYRVSDNVS